MVEQRELRPLPQDGLNAGLINAIVYILRGDGPGWVALIGFDGVYRNPDGSNLSTGNPSLFIKPSAGIPAILCHDSAGNVTFRVDDTGASFGTGSFTDILATGNIAWQSGTAFKITLDHAATADRVITVPDVTDTLALLGRAQTFSGLNTFSTTLTASNALTVGGLISANGGQIAFPAAQNASADANTMDDYEEGNWVPSVGGSATYTARVASYIKIGRMVTVWCALVVNAIGTGSTNTISGLPFTADHIGAGPVSQFTSLALNVSFIGMHVPSGTATAQTYATTAVGATSALTNVLGSGTTIVFSATYRTAN